MLLCALPRTGFFYFVELCLGFHVGFMGKLGIRRKLIMDGKAIAWYYIFHGQFLVDTITAVAWFAQVRCRPRHSRAPMSGVR
jgi:hypothetical protein